MGAANRKHLRGVSIELKEDVLDVALNVPRLEIGIYPGIPDVGGKVDDRVGQVSAPNEFDALFVVFDGANATSKFSEEGELPSLELSGSRSGDGVEGKNDLVCPGLPGW